MMQYKRETRKVLQNILHAEDLDKMVEKYGKSYGIDECAYEDIMSMIKEGC